MDGVIPGSPFLSAQDGPQGCVHVAGLTRSVPSAVGQAPDPDISEQPRLHLSFNELKTSTSNAISERWTLLTLLSIWGIALKIQALGRQGPCLICSPRCPQHQTACLAHCQCSGEKNKTENGTVNQMNE